MLERSNRGTRVLGLALALASIADVALAQSTRSIFVPLTPCRIVDTRLPSSSPITGGNTRSFDVVGAAINYSAQGGAAAGCGIPGFSIGVPVVTAVAMNVVAVSPSAQGNLIVYATDTVPGTASTLNFPNSTTVPLNVANGVIIPVRQDHAGADVTVKPNQTTHVVIDVTGYFMPLLQADGTGSGLDADLLDGANSTDFAAASHTHAGTDVSSGTIGEARIDPAICRDTEVLTIVKNGDGSGSGLDADLLDGKNALDFVDLTGAQTVAGKKTFSPTSDVTGLEVRQSSAASAAAPTFAVRNNDGSHSHLVVDAAGNLGIGTTSPLSLVHVSDVTTSPDVRVEGALNSDSVIPSLSLIESVGSNTSCGFRLKYLGASDQFRLGSECGNAPVDAIIVARGTAKVGIGKTAVTDSLEVAGDIRVGAGSTGCVKDNDATVIAGTCSSDERLKRDIEPFPSLLEDVAQLQPVHFRWRADDYPERGLGRSRSFGLIAQDVEKVFPEMVTRDEKGFAAVRYNELPLVLLQAVRELKEEKDALKRELRAQEERLRRLEAAVAGSSNAALVHVTDRRP